MEGGAIWRVVGALRRLPLAASLAVVCAPQLRAEEFFPTRDENPLLRGFYRPLASDSRADAGAVLAATFSIMNTLESERRSTQQLLVDGESDTLRLSYEDSIAHDWRYRVTVPVIRDSGGFLDSSIESWHRFFGFNPGSRPYYPKNQLVYFYSGKNRIDMQDSGTSIGDVSAETGWYAADSAERTISLWGGVEAPTGSTRRLTGDGAWDAALWAHAARRWPNWRLAVELGLAQPMGDEIFAGSAHVTSAFMRGAVTRDLGPVWSLRAQLDGQTRRVAGTELRFLGPSAQLTVGVVRQLAHRWRLQMGFAEDVAVNTAPDITFFLGIHD
jgi:Protein of unknown function (DUF3187)